MSFLLDEDDEILSKRKKLHINITSLIDVLFLLLIFFMVSSTFQTKNALKINLPVASGDTKVQVPESITILVSKDQKILLNEKELELSHLEKELSGLLPAEEKDIPVVQFKVDKAVPYGFAVQVMNTVKNSGFKTILALTQNEKK